MFLNFLRKSSAFTLIEVVVALVIFSLSVLAFAGLSVTSVRSGSHGGHVTEAATFAQDKLEELKADSWEKIASGTDQKTGPTGISYTRSWKVSEMKARNLKTVIMKIDWKDQADHSISFVTVISQ